MGLSSLLQSLIVRWRHSHVAGSEDTLPDAELLERFVRAADQAAFELLVWRHGALVLGVCRRLLRGPDVEDAFQATFLTLVRKAASVRCAKSLSSWLYKVAYRIALRLRPSRRRDSCGTISEEALPTPASPGGLDDDVRSVLDQEVHRLPEKYRTPVLLCYLQGLTTAEAAARLGCPRGTLLSWLSWARRRLAARLRGRGISLAAALTVIASTRSAPAASLVAGVAGAALRFAAGGAVSSQVAALVHGVVQSMFLTKLKWAVALLMVALVSGVGVGWWAYSGAGTTTPAVDARAAENNPKAAEQKPKVDKEKPSDRDAAIEKGLEWLARWEKQALKDAEARRVRIKQAEDELGKALEWADEMESDLGKRRAEKKVDLLELQDAVRSAEAELASVREQLLAEKKKVAQEILKLEELSKPGKEIDEMKARLRRRLEPLEREQEQLRALVQKSRARLIVVEEDFQARERIGRRRMARADVTIAEAEAELRRARGVPAPAEAKVIDWKEVDRKLDKLSRDLEELRREVRAGKE